MWLLLLACQGEPTTPPPMDTGTEADRPMPQVGRRVVCWDAEVKGCPVVRECCWRVGCWFEDDGGHQLVNCYGRCEEEDVVKLEDTCR